eukprot:1380549-Amorphochlora_amoeboformis.AAC.1
MGAEAGDVQCLFPQEHGIHVQLARKAALLRIVPRSPFTSPALRQIQCLAWLLNLANRPVPTTTWLGTFL